MKKRDSLFYCITLFFLFGIGLLFGSCNGIKLPLIQSYHYSPIGAIGVGPSGLSNKKIELQPYCCPSTAVEVLSSAGVTDNDFQWVKIPLNVPQGIIKSVTVCYNIKTNMQGQAYISQVRLTKMTTPNSAYVVYDDGTNLTSTTPTCYTSQTDVKVEGSITLALKVVLGSTDAIQIGGISLEIL